MGGMKVTVRNRGEVVLEAEVEPGGRVPLPRGIAFTSVEVGGYVHEYVPEDFDPTPPPIRPTLEWA